jgi:hypothetical protein
MPGVLRKGRFAVVFERFSFFFAAVGIVRNGRDWARPKKNLKIFSKTSCAAFDFIYCLPPRSLMFEASEKHRRKSLLQN